MNPFIELIDLKKQEQALAIAIKEKQQEALDLSQLEGEMTTQIAVTLPK